MAVGFSQPCIQWLPRILALGVKRLEMKVTTCLLLFLFKKYVALYLHFAHMSSWGSA
jgi:hypothetical protein